MTSTVDPVVIAREQRDALLTHAREWGETTETRFGPIIADLKAGRPITDRDLFVRFLWERVNTATQEGSLTPEELRGWFPAVLVLGQMGEPLDNIYTGGPTEEVVARERLLAKLYERNPHPTRAEMQEVLESAAVA
jgi:hypothetical protein